MESTRNFSIISHIDHGKSTLADRFLELTKTVDKRKMREQFLDMMDLEREKGITIKMQPCRMELEFPISNFQFPNKSQIQNSKYILNLVDTPGHVDFSYEVSRSLAAVEGAILLVDATKGIQAQTLANLELARKQNLVIIPAVNKIDLSHALTEETKEELSNLLNASKDEIFEISAKYGTNVEKLLQAIIEKIPPARGNREKPLRALIFDSKYDSYKGVIAYVRVVEGKIGASDSIYLIQTKTKGQAKEIGYFKPELTPARELTAGEIGYVATGVKEPGKVRVGDTITVLNLKSKILNLEVRPLPGYQEPQPMVFASIYPESPDDFELLKTSLAKLKLNDAAFIFEPETKEGLGRGYRCGFLGTLHAEIVSERLKREFGLHLVISIPSVVYKIINQKSQEIFIYSAADWPDQQEIKEIQQPWSKLEVVTPLNFLGPVSELLKGLKGNYIKTDFLTKEKTVLIYEVPLSEIIINFYDNLKGMTQGFASMNYEVLEYRPADLVKLEIFIAGRKEEVFSKIVERKEAQKEARKSVLKLKELLPPQLFSVPLQALVAGKIIARETIKARRRDVIAPLYGGDYTRKKKLLERQKKGKKELKEKGQVRIPPQVFLEMFRG